MIICILGASGSGKSTLQDEFVKNGFSKIVSTTSRPQRSSEKGDEYHFVSDKEFETMLAENCFLEKAKYNNWNYGLEYQSIKDNSVVVLTPHGLRSLKKYIKLYKPELEVMSIYLNVDRKSRLIKLIETRGDDQIEESYRRNLTDITLFDGIEDEVDYVLENFEYRLSPEALLNYFKQDMGI